VVKLFKYVKMIVYKWENRTNKYFVLEGVMTQRRKQLKHVVIFEEMKKKIFTEDIKPGDKLPSENELADKYKVSRQTVRKAIANLEAAGYVYAEHGRGTFCSEMLAHTKSSKNVAVVTTYLSDYIFPHIIKGIDEVMEKYGYSIMLKNTNNSRTGEAKCLEELLMKDIEGLIIEPSKSHIYCNHTSYFKKLDEFGIPYVFIQGKYNQMADKPHVLMDDEKGGYMITKYMISKGHRNIIGVFKSDDSQGQYRHKGYVRALTEAGIVYDPDNIIWFYTEDRKSHPYNGIKQLVNDGRVFDGIVCYNDQTAMMVIRALNECELKVPRDISVTGYDNSQRGNQVGLQLTTIVHPQEKFGAMAAEMLMKMINGEDCEKHIVIEPELIEGDTCR